MRTTLKGNLAAALWPKVRRRILGLLLANPTQEWHLRAIVRRTDLAPATVQREVVSLAEAGILTRRQDGNQVYYRANQDCPIFSELRSVILKTVGLADVLREALTPLGDQIEVAFVYGSIAEGTDRSASDVDLMIIGEVGLRTLAPLLPDVHTTLGREVNPVTMSPQELAERAADSDHFITTVLQGPKIFLIGDKNDLNRLAGSETASAT